MPEGEITHVPPALTPERLGAVLRARGAWSLVDVVAWIATEGRRIADPGRFTEALCLRARAAGAPLWRVRLAFLTLNPLVFSNGFTWTPEEGLGVWRVPHEVRRSAAFVGSPMQHIYEAGTVFRRRLTGLDADRDHAVLHDIARQGGVDYLGLPIPFSDGSTSGGFVVVTDRASGFSDWDIEAFAGLAEFLGPVLEAASIHHVARSLLDTYLGPRTGDRVLRGLVRRGDGETIDAAIWFCDLRRFTELTESLPLEAMLGTLNAYFEFVAAAVTANGGEILRFVGDAMLIVFPSAAVSGRKAACRAALDAAAGAFGGLPDLNRQRREAGEPEIRFGVGLHVGQVVYGNVGAPNRLDFTVMGQAVNRAARLESLTKVLGAPLLMSREFVLAADRPAHSLGVHRLKGVPGPQEVFAPGDA